MKRLRKFMPVLVILAGLLVLFYPTISNFLIMRNASYVVKGYDSEVEALSDEEAAKLTEAAHEWNRQLAAANSGSTDALTGAVNTESTDEAYNKLLNLNGDGMMGYITIPRLKETMPIYHGTSEKVLQVGIGHLEQTSLPVGGESTHAALSGHRGLPTAKLFTDLNLMKKGDRFYIKILKDTYAYQVDKITVVLPTNTKELAIEPGKDLVTLITCTPYAVNTHRLLVRAHRIPYTPEQEKDAEPTFHVDIPLQYVLPSLGLIVLLAGWRIWRWHDEKRRHAEGVDEIVARVIGPADSASGDANGEDNATAPSATEHLAGLLDGASQEAAPPPSPIEPHITNHNNDDYGTTTRKGPARHGRHA
ncbi:class C sortase [Bifidobacterium callitrichidarum]|uniref:Class C sortase n=1 Tax=Bifidobacterium callitrichidarum TaxID=2052941 RepID=A0A2U2NAA1_9BIFI|nr:class C sortase [Bifidobacterium callitrichidarum]PWG66085.1 class C sortase [Bifidobacterium callitrichidarum]